MNSVCAHTSLSSRVPFQKNIRITFVNPQVTATFVYRSPLLFGVQPLRSTVLFQGTFGGFYTIIRGVPDLPLSIGVPR